MREKKGKISFLMGCMPAIIVLHLDSISSDTRCVEFQMLYVSLRHGEKVPAYISFRNVSHNYILCNLIREGYFWHKKNAQEEKKVFRGVSSITLHVDESN